MTINYQFPTIRNISDVLPHIDGVKEFIVVKKEGYTVINYVMQGSDTFPPVYIHDENMSEPTYDLTAAMRRECRGLIFDGETGEVLSRRYHKFFNHGEKSDSVVDLSKPHDILEKLDGSMISPIMLNGGIRWTTKMGITEIAMQAEVFVAGHPEYVKFAEEILHEDLTPIFEWCSRQNQIVLDYPEDKLVLTAMRNNLFGTYEHQVGLEYFGTCYGIPVVDSMRVEVPLDKLVEVVRSFEDVEGIVIRFNDGHMVKVKADWYVSLHRAKSLPDNQRDVITLILDEKVDDLYPLLPVEDQARLALFQAAVNEDIHRFTTAVHETLFLIRSSNIERKDFAVNTHVSHAVRSAVFHLWDIPTPEVRNEAREWATTHIRRNMGSGASLLKAQGVLTTARWKRERVAAPSETLATGAL